MWSAHRIPQLHFKLSKPDRYFFIQVTTQFIRSRGWVSDNLSNFKPVNVSVRTSFCMNILVLSFHFFSCILTSILYGFLLSTGDIGCVPCPTYHPCHHITEWWVGIYSIQIFPFQFSHVMSSLLRVNIFCTALFKVACTRCQLARASLRPHSRHLTCASLLTSCKRGLNAQFRWLSGLD
jgi:hypothetical protein